MPPRGGGGGRGRGCWRRDGASTGAPLRLGGRWVDSDRRTPSPALRGQAPLRAASRRPGRLFLVGPDRGRTVPARKGVGAASGVGLGARPAGPPGAFGAKVGAPALLQRRPAQPRTGLSAATPALRPRRGQASAATRRPPSACPARTGSAGTPGSEPQSGRRAVPPASARPAARPGLAAWRRCRVSRSLSHPCKAHLAFSVS